jgi:hypothetical protein
MNGGRLVYITVNGILRGIVPELCEGRSYRQLLVFFCSGTLSLVLTKNCWTVSSSTKLQNSASSWVMIV